MYRKYGITRWHGCQRAYMVRMYGKRKWYSVILFPTNHKYSHPCEQCQRGYMVRMYGITAVEIYHCYLAVIFATPSALPINNRSALRCANSPLVTTPTILFIFASIPFASLMSRLCTSIITLPLSVTTPWR